MPIPIPRYFSGPDSFFWPYIATLPHWEDYGTMPHLWTMDELCDLHDTSVMEQIRMEAARWRHRYQRLRALFQDEYPHVLSLQAPAFSEERFLWAVLSGCHPLHFAGLRARSRLQRPTHCNSECGRNLPRRIQGLLRKFPQRNPPPLYSVWSRAFKGGGIRIVLPQLSIPEYTAIAVLLIPNSPICSTYPQLLQRIGHGL